MTRPRSYPPGIPGAAWAVGVAVALLISIVAAVPRYSTHRVVVAGGQVVQTGNTEGQQPGVIAPNGSAGHFATNGGNNSVSNNGTLSPAANNSSQQHVACTPSSNGGSTAPGVSANEIRVATTTVTSGVGAGFLGQAEAGMRAAINEVDSAGGICGRRITLQTLNSGWDGPTGKRDIDNWINAGNVFSLVGEPDSEGLAAAIDGGSIDRAGIPVVGTDGLLQDQYFSPWVFPVAASTVTNMHIVAKYAVQQLHAKSFGIVYDKAYKFGAEGARAFDQEVKRLTGKDIPGYGVTAGCTSANHAYCAIDSGNQAYNTEINNFDQACKPCDAVVMLLEPTPMETWMKGERDSGTTWYHTLFGGEPLFDDNLGSACDSCGGMIVWTGYHPAIQPFDAEAPVSKYQQSLKAQCPSCDPHNEFTEGAYIGMQLFIQGVKAVAASGLPLTRANLKNALDGLTFNAGLTSTTLHYGSGLPHLANTQMAAYSDNFSGSFNGWSYLGTSFVSDPAAGRDMGR
jgi:ABC-type branched-subunit amino acid transport system substrate-binding protein